MDSNLASTYRLIHTFLIQQSHPKVARVLQRAVKQQQLVVLNDGDNDNDPAVTSPPPLDDIIKEWTEWKSRHKNSKSDDDPSSDHSDSATSGSDSSDSDSVDASSKHTKQTQISAPKCQISATPQASKEPPLRKLKKAPSSWNDSSSDSDPESDNDSSSNPPSPEAKSKESGKKPVKTTEPKSKSLLQAPLDRASSQTMASDSNPTSECSSDPSSDDDDDDDDNDNDVGFVKNTAIGGKREAEESSDDESSSGSSTSQEDDKANKTRTEVKSQQNRSPAASSESSDSIPHTDSGSDSDSDSSAALIKNTKSKVKSNHETDQNTGSSIINKSTSGKDKDTKRSMKDSTPSAIVIAAGQDNDAKVTKKRRTAENGDAIATAWAKTIPDKQQGTTLSTTGKEPNSNGKPSRKQNAPFKRVDPDKVMVNAGQDNRYEAKAAPSNDYGQRAHQDLIVTRGAGFRKEKNKKKRGSYRGGEITMQSHSFKFDQ